MKEFNLEDVDETLQRLNDSGINARVSWYDLVGTGFSDQSLKHLHSKRQKIVRKTSPIKQTPDINWVDPC